MRVLVVRLPDVLGFATAYILLKVILFFLHQDSMHLTEAVVFGTAAGFLTLVGARQAKLYPKVTPPRKEES